jgi:hypothetical protein
MFIGDPSFPSGDADGGYQWEDQTLDDWVRTEIPLRWDRSDITRNMVTSIGLWPRKISQYRWKKAFLSILGYLADISY